MTEYVTVWVDDLPDLKRGEEIVRCRDCRRFAGYCEWCDEEEPDGFCAWGERNDANAASVSVSRFIETGNGDNGAACKANGGTCLTGQAVDKQADSTTQEVDSTTELLSDGTDSREKLEADVLKYYTHTTSTLMWPDSANIKTKWVSVSMGTVLEWLDRQAAITKRETLHDNPTCSGRSTCAASSTCTANRPISESADRETPKTAEIGASKDEIRDFDVWSVAYEIYCAGGYVDNGNEPNPPTDGIRELLDRQASITEREILSHPDERDEQIAELQQQVDELSERKCPGYDPARHYCKYHAQDFGLNDRTVSRLKRENSALARDLAECERMREGLRARLSEAIGKAGEIAALGDL